MSTLFRSLLALLAAMAMVLVWSGTATADPLVPTAEECASATPPLTCPPVLEGGGDTGETAADEDVDAGGTQGGEDAEGTQPPSPQDTEEFEVTQPEAIRELGEELRKTEEQDLTVSSTGSADDEQTDEPSGEPDPAAVGECIAGEVEELIVALEALLGAGFEELASGIEDGISTLDPADPTALPTFLEELPTMIEESGAEFSADVEALVRGSVEGIVACLPAPPEEPPGENPGGEEPPPGGTPVGHENPHYENCDDARAQGAAPVHAGEPGYGAHLDADDDGIGCEEETVVPVTHHYEGGLAYTGTELGPQLTLGGVLLLVGSTLLLVARRRA